MPSKKAKLLLRAFPIIFIAYASAGCTKSETAYNDTDNKNNQDKNEIEASQVLAEKTLQIAEHRCNGCGRCVQVDPEHFSFNRSDLKVEVISTKNLNSRNLRFAISVCRDRAIELI